MGDKKQGKMQGKRTTERTTLGRRDGRGEGGKDECEDGVEEGGGYPGCERMPSGSAYMKYRTQGWRLYVLEYSKGE